MQVRGAGTGRPGVHTRGDVVEVNYCCSLYLGFDDC